MIWTPATTTTTPRPTARRWSILQRHRVGAAAVAAAAATGEGASRARGVVEAQGEEGVRGRATQRRPRCSAPMMNIDRGSDPSHLFPCERIFFNPLRHVVRML